MINIGWKKNASMIKYNKIIGTEEKRSQMHQEVM